jgi:hypothetical protein
MLGESKYQLFLTRAALSTGGRAKSDFRSVQLFLGLFLFFSALSGTAQAGKIVLANDEWTLSDRGFAAPNDPGLFAQNIASWFVGSGTGGDFLAYSSVFGLTQPLLRDAVTSAGHTWTVSIGVPFTLSTLMQYDGVFLSGNPADNQVLIDYVNGGGNVYLAGGTSLGGRQDYDALQWNTFLNAFGLGLEDKENADFGNLPIHSTHPIFSGVDRLYNGNGNNVLDIRPDDLRGQILAYDGAASLYAVYESPVIPEPATAALVVVGLFGAALVKQGQRAQLYGFRR